MTDESDDLTYRSDWRFQKNAIKALEGLERLPLEEQVAVLHKIVLGLVERIPDPVSGPYNK